MILYLIKITLFYIKHYNLIFSLLSNNQLIAYDSQMDLWKQHSMIIDGPHFIDYEFIDYLRDHTEGNKCVLYQKPAFKVVMMSHKSSLVFFAVL